MSNTAATYQALTTSEYQGSPKFQAMVAAVAQPFCDAQAFLNGLPGAFDLDVATNACLDVDALWIGAGRTLSAPIDGYFLTFDDTADTGWDAGIWWLPHESLSTITSLDDNSFRLFCRFKIAANKWDGTTSSMAAILTELLSPATVSITDSMNMSINVTITGQPPSTLFKTLISNGGLPLKPAGVTVTYTWAS